MALSAGKSLRVRRKSLRQTQMNHHRFRSGQQVTFVGPAFMRGPTSEYVIVALLPSQAGQSFYRVKSNNEPYERVVSEEHIVVRLT